MIFPGMESWSCAPLAGESKPSLRVFVNSTGARLESSRGSCHGRQQHTGVPPWNRTYNDHSSSIPQMAGPSPRQCPTCAPPGSFGLHAGHPNMGVPPCDQTYSHPSSSIPEMPPPPPTQCPDGVPPGCFESHSGHPNMGVPWCIPPMQGPNCAPPGSFGLHAGHPNMGVPPCDQTYSHPSSSVPDMPPPPPMQCPNCAPPGFFGSHQSFPPRPNHSFESTDANLPPVHPEATPHTEFPPETAAASDPTQSHRSPAAANMSSRPSTTSRVKSYEVKNCRSYADICAEPERKEATKHAPIDFPCGPIHGSDGQLRAHVENYTKKISNLHGAFDVSLDTLQTPKNRAVRRPLKCTCKEKIGCNWLVIYELASEGWVLVKYKRHKNKDGSYPENHHNHELEVCDIAMQARRTARGVIPDDFLHLGKVMLKSGSDLSEVRRFLNELSRIRQLEVGGWTNNDVTNAFRATPLEKKLDSAKLIELLAARRDDQNLKFFAQHDSNKLVRVFVQLDVALSDWARGGVNNVLLFDPTWGTNCYGLKLCCFTTVIGTGQTVILAMAILDSESEKNFEWAFRCFAEAFLVAPAVIFTDGCDKIARAIKTVSEHAADPWYGVRHMLCVYHLSQNLFTHIRPLFPSVERWRFVLNAFWNIAKKADVYSVDSFEEEWNALVAYVHENAAATLRRTHETAWLQSLGDRRRQWAARYVFQSCTFGIHSSQRAESIHSSLKNYVTKASHMLWQLVTSIEDFNSSMRRSRAVESQILAIRSAANAATSCAVVRSLESKLTPYAFMLILQQERLMTHYAVKHADNIEESALTEFDHPRWVVQCNVSQSRIPQFASVDDNGRPYSFNEDMDLGLSNPNSPPERRCNLTWCSCLFPTFTGGLPCRHILAGCLQEGLTTYETTHISQKWTALSTEDVHRMQQQLLTRAPPSTSAPPRPSSSSDIRQLSQSQKYQLLISTFRDAAQLACITNKDFEFLLSTIQGTAPNCYLL